MTEKRQDARQRKLCIWKARLTQSDGAYKCDYDRMDRREKLYAGVREIRPVTDSDKTKSGKAREAYHVRNIVFENIESQVSTQVPQPKVTPKKREDEVLADKLERYLRNELDRLPFERMNDMSERTVPIQGGGAWLIEWDDDDRTCTAAGQVRITFLHPKMLAPQPGVYTGIEDMDWIIVKLPTTKSAVKAKYGVDVENETDSEPEVRTLSDNGQFSEDAVTEYIGFAKNDDGGIDRFVWVNDVVLEDLENYQARRQPICGNCGKPRPLPGQVIGAAKREVGNNDPAGARLTAEEAKKNIAGKAIAGMIADAVMNGGTSGLMAMEIEAEKEPDRSEVYDGGACPYCGADEWSEMEDDYEQVLLPITTPYLTVPGLTPDINASGVPVMRPTLIPFYKPDVYPIVLQRSVSVYGKLLGNSDVDMIEDQQNTINRLEQKILDRMIKAGTRIALPVKSLRVDADDGDKWYFDNAADLSMVKTLQFEGNLTSEFTYLSEVYEEARQTIGITDSFQGRKDATATSGTAKQFAAQQSAGRLESKRVMKDAAYADIFRAMFKFFLAYADEPRTFHYRGNDGEMRYEEISRYEFLRKDGNGGYYWNDDFLFSVDTSAPLASNREAMWQETRMNLQTGAFGDPTSTETLILFWERMEELHYPGAADVKAFLMKRVEAERQAAMMMRTAQAMPEDTGGGNGQVRHTEAASGAVPQTIDTQTKPLYGQQMRV